MVAVVRDVVVTATFDALEVVCVRVYVSRVTDDDGRFCIPMKFGPSNDIPAVTGVMLRVVVAASCGGSCDRVPYSTYSISC